jgi:predicted Zn-dependent protease
VTLWQKMMAAEKSSPPQFLSTHPSPANRVAELEARIPKVMPLYEAATHKG